MTRRTRLMLKLSLACALILVLVLFSRGSVDFVYTGF
jgi:hypothetical protein